MKKIIIIITLLSLITGCGNKTKEEEKDTKNKLTEDTGIVINEENIFDGMLIIQKSNFENQIGISLDKIESYFAAVPNFADAKIYIAIKPKEENIELVNKAIKSFLESQRIKLEVTASKDEEGNITDTEILQKIELINNYSYYEYNGYYVYIVDSNSDVIFEKLKSYLN